MQRVPSTRIRTVITLTTNSWMEAHVNRWNIIAVSALSLALFAATGTVFAQTTQPASGAAAPGGVGRGRGGFGRGPFVPPGPPAPVPPQVQMQRPTPQEVAQMNAALKQFVDANTSPDGPLLKKYASLINVPLPRDNPCIRPAPSARGNRHAALAQARKTATLTSCSLGIPSRISLAPIVIHSATQAARPP